MPTPFVTIAMPCLDEAAFIDACIRSVQAQTYPRDQLEILVADGGSTDGTRDVLARLAQEDARIRVIDNPERVQAAGLNRILGEARGEVIARMDVHCEYAPDYVEKCVAVLERTGGSAQARLDELQRRFEDLDGRDFAWTDVWRLGDAYGGFLRLLVDTKEAQVAALNAEGFSAEEYAWVRGAVLRAAGLPGVGYGVADFAGAFTGGAEPDVRPSAEPIPPANRELVERFRERLDEVAFLAALGL
jgi:glycosyltransferase involved in cell wall biosynthesis